MTLSWKLALFLLPFGLTVYITLYLSTCSCKNDNILRTTKLTKYSVTAGSTTTHIYNTSATMTPPLGSDQDQDYILVARTESEFDVTIDTRKLNLLATRYLNQLVRAMNNLDSKLSCAKWWSNPLETHRNNIIASNIESDVHLLEFDAESIWEKATFRVTVRVHINKQPNQLEFLNDSIVRADSFKRLLRGHKKFSCFDETLFVKDIKDSLEALCSCNETVDTKDTGFQDLPTWPKNVSFMVSDYLNLADYYSLFHIVPFAGRSICAPLKMLIMIHSATTHFEHRQEIRETYGMKANLQGKGVDLIFVLGRVLNETLQEMIEIESENFSDILQANFIDSYHNLTLKQISRYAYVYLTCSSGKKTGLFFNSSNYHPPKHELKADDDYFLNVDLALRVAEANPDVELIGCSFCGTNPIRHTEYMAKYYAPRYMYMGNTYPGYLSGAAYLVRSDVIPKFLRESLKTPILHIDDAYMTGIIPKALGIYPRNSRFFGYSQVSQGLENDKYCKLGQRTNALVRGSDNDTMKSIWGLWNQKYVLKNCTEITIEELKVDPLTDKFMKDCRYV